jgi:hypothetical protein
MAVIGFGFAHVFGKPGNGLAFLGMLFMLGGALWYAILRVQQRTAMRWWAKAQLIAATILCLLGVAAVMLVASRVTEGSRPDSLEYWRNSNQTYHADSRVALRQAYWKTAHQAAVVLALTATLYDRPCSGCCRAERACSGGRITHCLSDGSWMYSRHPVCYV